MQKEGLSNSWGGPPKSGDGSDLSNSKKTHRDTESPVERKRPRRSGGVYDVSYADSTDSQAERYKKNVDGIMKEEMDQLFDDDVMKIFNSETLVKKKKFINQCKAAFKKIKTKNTEQELQDSFNVFMKQVFCNSKYKLHDSHSKALPRFPGDSSVKNIRKKPDLTVTDRRKHFMVFVQFLAELKQRANKGSQGYYDAFIQAKNHAQDLFLGYGAVVPRKELWSLTTDGENSYLYKFFVEEDKLRFVQYPVYMWDVATVLVGFAHCYSFEPLEMMINLEIPHVTSTLCVNFNSCVNLDKVRVIHQSDLSIVFVRKPYVVKMNGLPKFKEGLVNEKNVYKKLKESDSTLPILQPIGYYESQAKKCSALVFLEEGTVLQTVEGLHTVVRVLRTMHDQLNLVHRDVRIPNLLRPEKRQDLSIDEGLSKDEKVYLIDFAFASEFGKPTHYQGSRETASEEVLEQIRDGAKYVTVRPQDDLISLVKVMILLYYNRNTFYEPIMEIVKVRGCKKAEVAAKLLETWKNIKSNDAVEKIFGRAWKAAETGNYVELTNEMIAIEQISLPKSK